MKPIFPLFITALLVAGCSLSGAGVRSDENPPATLAKATEPAAAPAPAEEGAAAEAEKRSPHLPLLELKPAWLYRFLLAEIAGQRGQLADAAVLFLELARETHDPRIARRATEIALHSRQGGVTLEAAQLWQALEPDSIPARQTAISLLAAQGRYAELTDAVAQLLSAEPHHIGQNLLRLNRMLARGGDRLAVRGVVDTVTQPYLQVPEAHYARALAAFEVRDLPAARAAIRRALEIKPDWEAAALFQVQLIESRPEAMAALADFIVAYPHATEAHMAYARALVSEKRYAEARREFDRLLKQVAADPAKSGEVVFAIAVLSLQLNDTAQAEKHLLRLVEIGHVEADKARYYLGQIAEEGKRWDEAMQWFEQVGRGEHYLPARLHAANVLARQGRPDAARQHLVESEAGPQERVKLLIGEAQILREAKRLPDAHAVLIQGLVDQPDQPELLYEAALLAEKLGRLDELESRLRRLIELRPDHAHAYNALGYSFADRNIRLPEARELIERALQLAPNDPFILDSQGWVLFRQGDAPGALAVLKTALGIRSDPEIAAHLGEVLWSLGRRDEARDMWKKAQREHPANEVLAETIQRFQP